MTTTAQARELRAVATAFDAQRGKLPILDDPHRCPEPIGVSAQLAELTELVDQLNSQVLRRATDNQATSVNTGLITTTYAAALEPAGQAVAALGKVSHQLAVLDQTWPRRDRPELQDLRASARAAIGAALDEANAALNDAALVLHSSSTTLQPTSHRLQAAVSRTTLASARPSPVAAPSASATAMGSTTGRGR